ncbi:hypothetical protein Gorai_006104, partial [Gossypium raimondii]|nr:hypothetical protein [Gossypium raimondii]
LRHSKSSCRKLVELTEEELDTTIEVRHLGLREYEIMEIDEWKKQPRIMLNQTLSVVINCPLDLLIDLINGARQD